MRCELVIGVGKVSQRFAQGSSAACTCRENAIGPQLRELDFVQPLHGAQRHPPDALDQADSQHRGHRPQLTDGERRDALKRLDVEIDVFKVDARFGMRDE